MLIDLRYAEIAMLVQNLPTDKESEALRSKLEQLTLKDIERKANQGRDTKPICKHCKSEDVKRDSWSEWNIDNQEFELFDTREHEDADWCFDCNEVTTFDWIDA